MGDKGNDKGKKLWLGGVADDTIQRLRAGDLARDLRKYGEVGMVEIKQRCIIVTMEEYRDADDVLREAKERSGRVRLCNEAFIVDEFRDSSRVAAAAQARGDRWAQRYGARSPPRRRRSRGSRSPSRRRSRRRRSPSRRRRRTPSRRRSRTPEEDPRGGAGSGRICEEARELMEKVRSDRQMSRDLEFKKIELRLSELNSTLQVKAIDTYLNSDFSAVRRPMGWFSSIINTLAMGLDHGSKPTDGGFKRPRVDTSNLPPRSDAASPRTLARRRRGSPSRSPSRRRERSPTPRGKRRDSRSPSRKRSLTRSMSRRRSRTPSRRRSEAKDAAASGPKDEGMGDSIKIPDQIEPINQNWDAL